MTDHRYRIAQLADAFLRVARANHYMVGVIETFSDDELDAAEQRLITSQNMTTGQSVTAVRNRRLYGRALDLIAEARLRRR